MPLPNFAHRWLFLGCCLASAAAAQGTRQWTSSRLEEFERGTPQNVGLRNDGRMEAAPALTTIASTSATYVWAIGSDDAGNLYAGTGAVTGGSQLLRIDGKGVSTTVASFKEANLQALQALGNGTVVAATSPDGKVYRVDRVGKPEVIFDAAQTAEKPKYLWALAVEPDGNVLIGSGAPAAIYRVPLRGSTAKPTPLFKSGDQHIRCLLVGKDGTIFAGSDGSGVIYRITPAGKPFALYAAPRHEITALSLDPAGNLYASAVGERRITALPALQVLPAATPTGNPTALAATTAAATASTAPLTEGSSIYRITPDGTPLQLLALREDVAYALAFRNGKLFVGTGNHGRIYRLDPSMPGAYTDVAHVDAREATAMQNTSDGLLIATASSGKVVRLADGPASDATFTSEVFDAEVAARWGRAELTASGGTVELYARSGNVESPREGLGDLWSEWKPVSPGSSPLPVPTARYLQWKAALRPGTTLAAVTINFLPRNLPPQVDDIVVQPGARLANTPAATPSTTIPISFRVAPAAAAASSSTGDLSGSGGGVLVAQRDRTAVTARWLAHDPNGDELIFAVYFRDVHEQTWHLLKDRISERAYSFDANLLPDGEYELRVVASDAPVHPDADTLTAERVSAPFTVDTTPPVPGPLAATLRNGELRATIEVRDTTSPISHAEFSIDTGPWQYLEPVGKLSDSLVEHYDLTQKVTTGGEHTIAMRFVDRYENAVSVKAIVR